MKSCSLLLLVLIVFAACSSKQSSNKPNTEDNSTASSFIDTTLVTKSRQWTADVIAIDTATIQPPTNNANNRSTTATTTEKQAKEPLHALQIKDNKGNTVRSLQPTEFNSINLSALTWVNDDELLFISSGLFDVTGFWLYQSKTNKIFPIEYSLGMTIFETATAGKAIQWNTQNDSITGFNNK